MKYLTITGVVGTLIAGAALAPAAFAAPVVSQATGSSTASIQATVDQFRNDLGNNNAGGPPAQTGRRQIGWDGVPDGRAAPSFMPEGQFRNLGALFSTPGLGFEVSGDDNDDAGSPDADPDQVDFTDLNATYDAAFEPFSQERLFAPVGSNITETRFVVPATNIDADTNGFGAVFSDVDAAGQTELELLEADGDSLGSWDVPATPGQETYSFLGVRFNAGERAALARITTGGAALGGDDVSQSGPADIVVMDDFIYGEPLEIVPAVEPPPAPPQPPVVDTEAPEVKVKGAPKKIELDKLLRGLKLELTPDEAASYEVALLASARSVEIARKRNDLILAEKSLGEAEGERKLKLKPSRRLLKETPSKFKVRLEVEATDGAGNTDTVRKSIKVTS
jgi:hypothetical protein